MGATGCGSPRPVGVRRCLTRPARRAGNACRWVRWSVAMIAACRDATGTCRAHGAAGEAAPRPYKVGQPIPGRADGCHGGVLAPPCRGQALPDPSGPPGPVDPRRWSPRWCYRSSCGQPATLNCRAMRRGRARQRLAPTRWGDPSPVGHAGATVGRWPRPVGVRRCLTRPARRAGNDTADTRRRSVAITAACRSATWMCRAYRRGRARRRLAPTRWGDPSPVGHAGATVGCWPRPVGVRRCLTRPARRAGNPLTGRWSRYRRDRGRG